MKKVSVALIAVTIYCGLMAVGGAIFAGALGQFAQASRLPSLSWWQSSCFLACISVIGVAFGYAGAATRSS